MPTMTHRERVLAALSHRQPDRVPIDLGSTPVTGISAKTYDAVKHSLGLDLGETRIYKRQSQLAVVDPQVLELFGVDARGIQPGAPDNRPDVESKEEDAYTDEWGLLERRTPGADTYFVANAPLDGEITVQDIMGYRWPDPDDPGRTRGLREQVMALRASGDYAIIISLPGSFIQQSQLLRGFSSWYLDVAMNPQILGALLDHVMEVQMATCTRILDAVGDVVDVVMSFDDLAMQDRLIVSPSAYRKYLEPRLVKFYQFIRTRTRAKILFHTDGAIMPVLPSLVEIGIDGINPLQVSAKGMADVAAIKQEFGDKLFFWGGIDTQHILPHGTPDDVRSEVVTRVRELNRDGGYVLASVHNIQSDVPAENVIAMFGEAAQNSPEA